ncbi:CTP synthase-like protein [Microthyrium microscopicum]|uniref:CTP synthase n=1 Tax=Microthyrium microscopicum TaxID=703497 RepID=A0A6A6UUN6_9PEZI|nr:CTP synthase-like protein [Microthyrium microscopicum]
MSPSMKYVLVSGGVISGVGKGIIASSSGLLLKTMGMKVSSIKIDPYLNVDAGTMNPKEHGEVFVLDDGGEVDLDLGNYERYLNITLTRENNITTGKIYLHVIEKERRGDYLGRTVQVVPNITDAIIEWIQRVAKIPVDDTNEEPDVCIIELGGTVGDMESMPFVEALVQLKRKAGRDNFFQIHVSYIPTIHGEQKTKPTQMAIKQVRSYGLIPDLIACRCERDLEAPTINKIAQFCHVENDQVLVVRDMPSIYQVPLLLETQGLVPLLKAGLRLDDISVPASLLSRGNEVWDKWKGLTTQNQDYLAVVSIALVGKYTEFHDSYLSVLKALEHSAMQCQRKLEVKWVDSEHLEPKTKGSDSAKFHKAWHEVCTADGILVPGGFGTRGTEGMIAAANWARENDAPYLGICLGMQIAVIEYARNVCGVQGATSEEFSKETTPKTQSIVDIKNMSLDGPVPDGVNAKADAAQLKEGAKGDKSKNLIVFMPEIDKTTMGGTMRLGRRPTHFQPQYEWSKLRALYGNHKDIHERHRHRYEVNPAWVPTLEEAGLAFVGKDDENVRMEIVEIKDKKWFVGVQFHPEYLSRVLTPSRPYLGFVAACAGMLKEVTEQEKNWNADQTTVNGKAHGAF